MPGAAPGARGRTPTGRPDPGLRARVRPPAPVEAREDLGREPPRRRPSGSDVRRSSTRRRDTASSANSPRVDSPSRPVPACANVEATAVSTGGWSSGSPTTAVVARATRGATREDEPDGVAPRQRGPDVENRGDPEADEDHEAADVGLGERAVVGAPQERQGGGAVAGRGRVEARGDEEGDRPTARACDRAGTPGGPGRRRGRGDEEHGGAQRGTSVGSRTRMPIDRLSQATRDPGQEHERDERGAGVARGAGERDVHSRNGSGQGEHGARRRGRAPPGIAERERERGDRRRRARRRARRGRAVGRTRLTAPPRAARRASTWAGVRSAISPRSAETLDQGLRVVSLVHEQDANRDPHRAHAAQEGLARLVPLQQDGHDAW